MAGAVTSKRRKFMANRVIRDWTDSERVNALSWQAEVLFTRLCMKADDYGSFHANSKLVRSLLFPLKSDAIRETDVTRWLDECEKAGLIVFYEASDKWYLRIINFGQRLRAMKKRFPDMPNEDGRNPPQPAADCLPEGKGKGSRKEEEVELPPPTRDGVLLEMFKRTTSGFEDDFLKLQVQRFLNKYPNCVALQAGGLVNSWAANLNKAEQEKWKQQSKSETPVVRKSRDQEMFEKLHES